MRRSATQIALSAACLSLLAAPSARAASAPTAAAGTNSFDGHGGTVVRGYVNPNGEEVTSCSFEYGPTESYGQSAPCAGRNEVQKVAVSANAGQFRLSFEGQTTPDIRFDASATLIRERLEELPAIGAGNVRVGGLPVNVGGATVTFVGALAERDVEQMAAENGTEPLTGLGESVTVTTIVQGGATGVDYIGAGEVSVPVIVDLGGLTPGGLYHFRVLATNAAGNGQSEDGVFAAPAAAEEPSGCPNEAIRTDQHATQLPECRAYEMVSPPGKNGGQVIEDDSNTRVTEDGSTVAYEALAGFGDVVGGGLGFDYLAERSTNPEPGNSGWSTHGTDPPQPAPRVGAVLNGADTHYVGLSSELTKGVVRAAFPIYPEKYIANSYGSLYRREDLRAHGNGTYQLLSECLLCAETETPLPPKTPFPTYNEGNFVEGTPDLGHVIFESTFNLVAGASGNADKLYEWSNGTLSLVGIKPNGQPFTSSRAGSGGKESFSSESNIISADGENVFFTESIGRLYDRIGGAQTIQLDASERTSPIASAAGATFWAASDSGSRVFFTTSKSLTDESPTSGTKLYMYDTTKPASDPHNLTLIATEPKVVLGASADGSYLYFISGSQLLPGHPKAQEELYLWHEGQLTYVAPVSGGDENRLNLIGGGTGFWGRVSTDGELMFTSDGEAEGGTVGPTGYDQGGCGGTCNELYTYLPETNQLQCASCDPAGAPATANAFVEILKNYGATTPDRNFLSEALSRDGRYLFFDTAQPLTAADTNGQADVYAYDTATGSVRILSSGNDGSGSYFLAASPDGRDVLIATRQRLVGWDVDGAYDLYDVRVGGGFPEPAPVTAPCEGESCLPGAQGGPTATSPSSATLAGSGNPPHRLRCPKGKRLVHRHGKARCVPRRHRHKGRAH